ncbi:MAG TPA: excinuclease ABC subunit UvrA [Acidobacteriota bacterium]|nr:excinuclease ABC subunit UvrA [Acidobacteriota bacterium]
MAKQIPTAYDSIIVKGAREHNLKNIDVTIPKNQLVVITGLSGSGKSTLAFDTIYAEGQRRYVESLSAYARQFLGVMNKPDVDSIEGLSPAISIEQKTTSKNPRSTVGTVTEIYDYLRLLYARCGKAHCPICEKPITPQTSEQIAQQIQKHPAQTKIMILAPVIRDMKGTHEQIFKQYAQEGFSRVEVDNAVYDINDPPKLDRYKKHDINIVVDRLIVKKDDKEFDNRLNDAVETGLKQGSDLLIVKLLESKEEQTEFLFNRKGGCVDHPHVKFEELQPRLFSFNSPFGACPDCHGLGFKQIFDPKLLVDYSQSIADGCVHTYKGPIDSWRRKQLMAVAKFYAIDMFTPFGKLSPANQKLLLYGEQKKSSAPENSYFSSPSKDSFEGIIPLHERLYRQTESEHRREDMLQYMAEQPCDTCMGKRLKPESLSVTINDKSIIQATDMNVADSLRFFMTLKLTPTQEKIAKQVLKEIVERLSFLRNVGLGYLNLSRSAGTLSGGEAQRIRLATQIGSNLTGVLYVLDEPSIGLHQRDNHKLIETLKRLRDIGNTLIVVEHDEDTMLQSDHLIDMGPGAGIHGGNIIYSGPPKDIGKESKSLTGQYLSGKRTIASPKTRRKATGKVTIVEASENNLQNVTVDIPLGILCVITGVSGSGKSTLINETLFKALHNHFNGGHMPVGKHKKIEGLDKLDKVIDIDQSPIGRTPRSNPATYTKVFTDIRELFSMTKEAKIRGYEPGRFSFNVSGGRCEACQGDGVIKIEMNFLPDVYVQCEECKGKRYNQETLQITYKDKNISDVLEMSVEEALSFFENIPSIHTKLDTLNDVGLGYIKLGQSATTLSGGEAQRIKLTSELAKRGTGKTIYILDEPTTGLHFEDVRKLLEVLNRLVDKGNSVVVIEHNLDVIKCADHIIDLGPEGGTGGGQIIAEGTPEQIIKNEKSHTGEYLKKILKA